MRNDEKKAAIATYRERKVIGGVYVVRCTATAQMWVGQWPNLDTIQNRIWFTLRLGTHPNQELQECWRRHGPDHFQFEILERLDEEESTYVRDSLLRERGAHWRSSLDAKSI